MITDVGAARDVVDGRNGSVVGMDDLTTFRLETVAFLSDDNRRERAGQRARATALDHYSVEATVRTLRQIYDDVLQASRASP